jgi:diketogulonate reductase-like aldo/keto reductase
MQGKGTQMQSWAPFAEGRNQLFANETLVSLAQEHGVSVAQIVLRWLVQRNVIAIPKSVHRERIEQNFQIFQFTLSDADMARIAALDTGKSCFFSHYDPEIVSWLSSMHIENI